VSKQIWPTLHYADRPISSVIGNTFANFFWDVTFAILFQKAHNIAIKVPS